MRSVLVFLSSLFVFSCLMANDNPNISSISRTFDEIANLPNFVLLPKEQLEEIYPNDLGIVKATCHPNSRVRNQVLEILEKIPSELLYSELRDDKDRITRCYIEKSPNGEAQMLVVIIGIGGNDLMVTLFSKGSLEQYIKTGDSIKE